MPMSGVYSLQEAARLTGLSEAMLRAKFASKSLVEKGVTYYRKELITPLIRQKSVADDANRRNLRGGPKSEKDK